MEHQQAMKKIPLIIPTINDQDIEVAVEVLRSGMLVQGKQVALAEDKISQLTNTSQAIMVSNGTASLHLALIALGIKANDEVIVPAFSYVATANVVELIGAIPVFVDIDIATFNIDANKIEAAITPRTKAIMVVHEFGLACDIEKVMAIAKKHSLFVIEDAACALGATYNNKPVGSFGEFGSFSFHPRKAITSGEGGALTTNDKALADKIRILRNHGISYAQGAMDFVDAGYNYRMTEMQAALLNSQMDRFHKILDSRTTLANLYLSHIKNEHFVLPVIPTGHNHTWQTFHTLVKPSLDRSQVMSYLKSKGIETNYGAQCIPDQQFYKNKYKLDSIKLFPNAMQAFKNGLALPLFDKMSEEDAWYVINTLNDLKP
jgi:perosamine synthetase